MAKRAGLADRVMQAWLDLRSLFRNGATERGFARKRLQQLRWKYLDDKERYYQPDSQRKKLSAESLFLFPEVWMLADEAEHSLAVGNLIEAHAKIDQAHDILRQAAHKRLEDEITLYAQERAKGKK